MRKEPQKGKPLESLTRQVEQLARQVQRLEEREEKVRETQEQVGKDVRQSVLKALEEMGGQGKGVAGIKGAVLCAGSLHRQQGEAVRRGEWFVKASLDELMAQDPTRVARALSALANEGKIKVMQALFWEEKSVAELAEATGLTQPQIYHHMRDLLLLGFVAQTARNVYRLFGTGWVLMLSGLAAAHAAAEGDWSTEPAI